MNPALTKKVLPTSRRPGRIFITTTFHFERFSFMNTECFFLRAWTSYYKHTKYSSILRLLNGAKYASCKCAEQMCKRTPM